MKASGVQGFANDDNDVGNLHSVYGMHPPLRVPEEQMMGAAYTKGKSLLKGELAVFSGWPNGQASKTTRSRMASFISHATALKYVCARLHVDTHMIEQ
mmetsp:Transcript_137038/g.255905  ORF Transcript_137038/g.255905 Transcript_137038/m.255905 type:complete len:98 (-) Transcript_137038:66-359(-)